MEFIVAGDLSGRRDTIKKMIENIKLPKGKGRLELPEERPRPLEKPVFVSRPSVKTLHFFLDTFAVQRFEDPEWDALGLVNTMLTATLHSRILGEARERGLVYSMGSNLDITRDSSLWWFGAQVIPKNAPALFDIIIKEIKRVRAGDVDPTDLDAAKQYLLGRHQRGAQTVGGIVGGYGGRYYFDGVIDDYDAIPDRIKAVTKERIIDATERMFSDKIGGLGVLGNSRSRAITDSLNDKTQVLWKS